MEYYKDEKKKVKICIYQSKKEVQEEFGRKMNQDVNGNRKLFWKEVTMMNRGKMENSNKIKDGNGRLVLKEAEIVHMSGFDGVRTGTTSGESRLGERRLK